MNIKSTCFLFFWAFSIRNVFIHEELQLHLLFYLNTVVPVMNGHPRDQAKVSVHYRWPPIRGTLTLKCVGRGIDNVAVQDRWPLTMGVA